jgi:alkanesulfonate monooxygenase SsuD/methylene tetrahydromethanopterin reductase-like flavin-dependent oxidoreductase (luciferase family)
MKFGVFDHLDRGDVPLSQLYEDRLRLAEVYDREGFHAYHVAEHHSTPLGMAASPSVFLAAVAQRTKRLRFGPLVYTLSLSHPLRIIEEVCMLDQMGNGRLELGIGKGSSPYEMGYFGVTGQNASPLYHESYDVVMQGLQHKEVNFKGEYFQFEHVPMELECVQKPHPPIWYGLSAPAAVPWAAQNSVNIVCNGPSAPIRAITDRYREEWKAHHRQPAGDMPFMGLGRHIVIAGTRREAYDIGKRAFARWYDSLQHLWRVHGNPMKHYPIPEDYAAAVDAGILLVGTPDEVGQGLKREIEVSGVNYVLTRFAFGDLTFEESLRSVNLFTTEIMPRFVNEPALA